MYCPSPSATPQSPPWRRHAHPSHQTSPDREWSHPRRCIPRPSISWLIVTFTLLMSSLPCTTPATRITANQLPAFVRCAVLYCWLASALPEILGVPGIILPGFSRAFHARPPHAHRRGSTCARKEE